MEQLEMVKKLHDKAGVTYDEARDALVASGWDMLEAVRILEEQGKITPLSSSMTTYENPSRYEEVRATADPGRKKGESLWNKLTVLVSLLLVKEFRVVRHEETIVRLPLLVALIIFLGMFKFTVAAMIIGLFLDCKYSVEK